MRTNTPTDKNYDYDYSGIDESYEEFGEEYDKTASVAADTVPE